MSRRYAPVVSGVVAGVALLGCVESGDVVETAAPGFHLDTVNPVVRVSEATGAGRGSVSALLRCCRHRGWDALRATTG